MTAIALSSGHGLHVGGASGILNEVEEARKVVNQLAKELDARDIRVATFHDDTSTTQGDNLNAIVNWHNAQARDYDISVHFNAFEPTEVARGTEVLYLTQAGLAAALSASVAAVGLIDRGAKKRTDLKFLNATTAPAVLIEVCFVDSEADCKIYSSAFKEICANLADVFGDEVDVGSEPEAAVPQPEAAVPRVDIQVRGEVEVTVNGQPVVTPEG